ncbi:uncharacterized protein LOC119729269 [Patiria miniata]|uniref:Uncharacterized protein n=1 Tax=Patiria miniata TaxID=46514 RepID=A0A914A2G7_PATMI|nr:uncharacterized protein LOC119729269 [Patiria miniata]
MSGLQQLQQHPICLGVYPTAVCMLSLVASLMAKTNTEALQDFCAATVSGLWFVITAGDSKYLKPEGYEILWRAFHKYRLEVNDKWIELLQAMGLYREGQHVHLVCQFLLQAVLQAIIEDRNKQDKPIDNQAETKSESLSPQEEQVLRYVSGYIPFSLFKNLNKQKNDTAMTYCKFLKSWKVDCSDETARTFFQYTNDWIDKQNRGGLFRVSDGVYLLFRAMEQETCKYLTKNNLKTFQGCDIQSTLLNNIKGSHRVQTYWCSLTQGKITGDTSTNLLNMTVKKWIKIRAKAFINVYLNLKKATHGHVGKKAEKALRKDL